MGCLGSKEAVTDPGIHPSQFSGNESSQQVSMIYWSGTAYQLQGGRELVGQVRQVFTNIWELQS